jgi:hypothetical protein
MDKPAFNFKSFNFILTKTYPLLASVHNLNNLNRPSTGTAPWHLDKRDI